MIFARNFRIIVSMQIISELDVIRK